MKLRRNGNIITIDEGFRFLLGVNYWSRKLNIRMWRDWDRDAIEEDVKLMKELGIRAIRFSIKNEDFADEDTNIYPSSLKKLREFLDMLAGNGIVGFCDATCWSYEW